MPTTSDEQQVGLTPEEQFALTDVYRSLAMMIRGVAVMTRGWSTQIPAVKNFQESWNANIEMMRVWSGEGPTGVLLEILQRGLDNDGRYGLRTATAMSMLLYVLDERFRPAAEAVPISASGVPSWYRTYQTEIDKAMSVDFALPDGGLAVNPALPVNEPGVVTVTTMPAPPTPAPYVDPRPAEPAGGDLSFEDDGSTIVSTAKRIGWSAPLWAVGIGLATASTVIYLVARRTRRRGSARV